MKSLNAIELNSLIERERGIFFVPYSKTHPHEMNITSPELRAAAADVDVGDLLMSQAEMGICTTVILDGRPCAIFGSIKMWDGVHESWAVIDDFARTKPKQMVKIGRKFMDIVKQYYSLHRQQVYVRTDDPRAARYALALGFKTEGIMLKYTSDLCDSFMMARY